MIKITITADTPEELLSVLSGMSRKAEKPFDLEEVLKIMRKDNRPVERACGNQVPQPWIPDFPMERKKVWL